MMKGNPPLLHITEQSAFWTGTYTKRVRFAWEWLHLGDKKYS